MIRIINAASFTPQWPVRHANMHLQCYSVINIAVSIIVAVVSPPACEKLRFLTCCNHLWQGQLWEMMSLVWTTEKHKCKPRKSDTSNKETSICCSSHVCFALFRSACDSIIVSIKEQQQQQQIGNTGFTCKKTRVRSRLGCHMILRTNQQTNDQDVVILFVSTLHHDRFSIY